MKIYNLWKAKNPDEAITRYFFFFPAVAYVQGKQGTGYYYIGFLNYMIKFDE